MARIENVQLGPNPRDGLFHVDLPGVKKDPLWTEYMERASKRAVDIMVGGSGSKDDILKSTRNVAILIRRLKRVHGDNPEALLPAVGEKVQKYLSQPTLRDITDYVIADEHYNYSLTIPTYKPTNAAYVISNYGIPRELEPVLETPFRGLYATNPYQGYVEKALECRERYSDADGYMRAPLTEIVIDPEQGYVFAQSALTKGTMRLTRTETGYWWHSDVENLDAIWGHLNHLYSNLAELAKHDPTQDLIEPKKLLISQIAWWHSQGMSYARGSAGIGNGLLQSLFDFSNIQNSPYKEGVSPDLEALVTPLPLYVKNFDSFFVKKLEPSKTS